MPIRESPSTMYFRVTPPTFFISYKSTMVKFRKSSIDVMPFSFNIVLKRLPYPSFRISTALIISAKE